MIIYIQGNVITNHGTTYSTKGSKQHSTKISYRLAPSHIIKANEAKKRVCGLLKKKQKKYISDT